MLQAALWALGGIVVLTTVLPFIRMGWWWVRVCDFPRLQLFVLGLAVLMALLALRPGSPAEWLAVSALATAVLYQGYRILPYTPLWSVRALPSRDPDPDRNLPLLIANVLVRNATSTRGGRCCAGRSTTSSSPRIPRGTPGAHGLHRLRPLPDPGRAELRAGGGRRAGSAAWRRATGRWCGKIRRARAF